MGNLIDPRYLYKNCLKATGEHTLDIMKSLGKLFDTKMPDTPEEAP